MKPTASALGLLVPLVVFVSPAPADPGGGPDGHRGQHHSGHHGQHHDKRHKSLGFVEVAGNWGVQLGRQDYVPDGPPGSSEHPFTKGFGANVTAGLSVAHRVALLLDYGFGTASSRKGEVTGALAQVQGSVSYHTVGVGARLSTRAGIGKLYMQFGVGVMLPFETELEYDYAPELGAIGITGHGSMVTNYNMGFGAQGAMGYQFSLGHGAYLGTELRVQSYESNNDGQAIELDNFVTDFTAPQPITGEINHGTTRAARPHAYSVQDVRFHLALGYRF